MLVDLFSKNRQEPRRSFFSSDQVNYEHRYSKRHRVDDDGPIDHDLMAALGFGKNRQKRTEEGIEKIISRPPERETNHTTERVTTVGDYLRSVPLPPKENDMVLFSPVTVDRKPPLEHPKCPPPPPPPPPPVQKVANITSSVSSVASPKENCRDLKALQRKAYEAQIAREEAMTKYYQLKAKKLELEIAQLQQGENGVAGRP
ncbi:unnamed protein product [Heligmosomoides polygyrus]|uniref:Uncharacterized protein n=1 Tax=Heligmosomoides polygyrus TaxID=6339 RepID=A0A3P7WMD8_HELPZ|nr:unnamed protein product [Heligmosomoides polygyrus]